jgi:hypothetical protein
MNDQDLIRTIKDIVFSVPDEIYKFTKPKNCFKIEWDEATPKEKAYLLVFDLLLETNRKQQTETEKPDGNIMQLRLGKGPKFLSQADENMFFRAINSLPSFVRIVGEGVELNLFYNETISDNEVKFLIDLLTRYQMPVSPELKKLSKTKQEKL